MTAKTGKVKRTPLGTAVCTWREKPFSCDFVLVNDRYGVCVAFEGTGAGYNVEIFLGVDEHYSHGGGWKDGLALDYDISNPPMSLTITGEEYRRLRALVVKALAEEWANA